MAWGPAALTIARIPPQYVLVKSLGAGLAVGTPLCATAAGAEKAIPALIRYVRHQLVEAAVRLPMTDNGRSPAAPSGQLPGPGHGTSGGK